MGPNSNQGVKIIEDNVIDIEHYNGDLYVSNHSNSKVSKYLNKGNNEYQSFVLTG